MRSRWRCQVVAAAMTAALAGCGGSDPIGGASSRGGLHAQGDASSANALTLPASSEGPTTCTVYETGYATQVIFESQNFVVKAECQAWTSVKAGEGYLWGYQPADVASGTAAASRVCDLTDPHRNVTASVVEDAGFRSVSAAEQAQGSAACASILAAGWIERADGSPRCVAPPVSYPRRCRPSPTYRR